MGVRPLNAIRGRAGAPRLVALEPARESSREFGTPGGYAGGLSISPSGRKVAYWIDNEQLEVREVNASEPDGRASALR